MDDENTFEHTDYAAVCVLLGGWKKETRQKKKTRTSSLIINSAFIFTALSFDYLSFEMCALDSTELLIAQKVSQLLETDVLTFMLLHTV